MMKTVLNDLESHNLTLTEAVNMAQNRLLWRLLAVSGATHSLVVQVWNDDDAIVENTLYKLMFLH